MIIIKDSTPTGLFGAMVFPEDRCILCVPISPDLCLNSGDTELRAFLIAEIARDEYGLRIEYRPLNQTHAWTLIECQFDFPSRFVLVEGLPDGWEGRLPITYSGI
jgi:hypothetical protein